ncbi:MAG: thiamine pyrophosphate-binding protein [Candidatus Omnitrophota bacterium]|nr:MAG: thiamine pyrophosphate-binding protein [Candidatus Omnitrophota bacterium]
MELTGAQIIVRKLAEHDVKIVFEYPGGTICSILDELSKDESIKTFMCRHEQAVIHAADAYARLTQRPSVCMVTSGPGASNLVTGIANAFMDSVPIVIISGQVAEWDLKKDKPVRQRGFQELDIVSVVKTITKASFLVNKVSDIAEVIDKAFFIAAEGRPGPVLVDIPINMQYTSCGVSDLSFNEKITKPQPRHSDIVDVAKRLISSKKPLVVAGGGVILSKASEPLMTLLKKYQLPAAQTLMGVTSVSCDYELNLGFVGYAGSRLSNRAVKEADFVLGVGLRFDNRAFPQANKEFDESAYIVHVDCDRNEFNHRVTVNKTVFADAEIFLAQLLGELEKNRYEQKNEWVGCINSWKKELKNSFQEDKPELNPKFILNRLSELLKGRKAVITTDVGQHQLWTAQYFKFRDENSLVTSGGMGTMGFGLPAAIGAQ